MSNRIILETEQATVKAELNDSLTASKIWHALPITGRANTWGDEIYFEIPVEDGEAADARAEVDVGELGYWPVGSALCIFFGPTPVSTGQEPRAASPVNVVGQVLGDATVFRGVDDGDQIVVRKAEE